MNGGILLETDLTELIVAGLLALFGAALGALLAGLFTRRTEHEKWLRQERSTAFSNFTIKLNDATQEACEALADTDCLKREIEPSITNIFGRLEGSQNAARLYLDQADRDKFSGLMNKYWTLLLPSATDDQKVHKAKDIRKEIQALFEETLDGRRSSGRSSSCTCAGPTR